MVFRSTLSLCPECSCHVRGEQTCPHCGADLSRPKRARSVAALSLGLVMAMTMGSGCLEESGPETSDDDESSYVGNSVVATYGVAPSVSTGGAGGAGGGNSNSAQSNEADFDDDMDGAA